MSIEKKEERCKKPLEITLRTTDGPHLYTTGSTPPRPHSTPTTDIADEIVIREAFDKPRTFRQTPDSYLRNLRDNNEEDDEDSDPMSGKHQPRNGLTKARSEPRVDRATQIIKKHKNVGTMANFIKKCDSCYDVQSQTSTTKASGPKQHRQTPEYDLAGHDEMHPKKPIHKHPQNQPTVNGVHASSPTRPRDQEYDKASSSPHLNRLHGRERSPSPPRKKQPSPSPSVQRNKTPPFYQDPYQPPEQSSPIHLLTPITRCRSPASPHQSGLHQLQPSPPRSRSPPTHHDQASKPFLRSPSPPTTKHRSPSEKYYEPSSIRDLTGSAPPPKITRIPEDQRQMTTRLNETRLDNPKSQYYQGEQRKQPSRKDTDTTPRTDTKYPIKIVPYSHLNREPSDLQHQVSNSPLLRDDDLSTPPRRKQTILLKSELTPATRKSQNYQSVPTRDNTSSNQEQKSSKHLDYQSSADYRREYNPQPVISDRVAHRRPEDEKLNSNFSKRTVFPEKDIRQLPSEDFIISPSANITQPDTLPRTTNRHQSSKNKQYDDRYDTGTTTREQPYHQSHGQHKTSRTASPPLNIGTEKIIRQSAINEFAAPFEAPRYIEQPNRDFHITSTRDDLRSRNGGTLLLPVLNSSRTYVFEKKPVTPDRVRQSRTNDNFYLRTAPALRSLNSSQIDDSEMDTYRQDVSRSQVA